MNGGESSGAAKLPDPPPPGPTDVKPVSITEELKRSYLGYAMSVIVSRALPDARDGLKPVHRRILYSMHASGYVWNRAFRKSARVVGDVIGKYHPHGEGAVYDALVRLAQEFSMRLPLVEGQGNFGSVDGDMAAAMRYTEVRLERISESLTADIGKDTVDFQENYDNSETEPTVLPVRFPNLLVNGAGGIAVGMATNIPPHNPTEIIEGAIALIDSPALPEDDLLDIVTGPDFPTGGLIIGKTGIHSAYKTGRGTITMRARVDVRTIRKGREALIVSEIPYQVNKATLVEKIAELVRDKRVDGISDIRDESDRDGMRVVIELRRDADAQIILHQLYRYTALQTNFSANMLALHGNRPQLMTLRGFLEAFIGFREEVIIRRTRHDLTRARTRAHLLVGLAIAVANIDEIVTLIRTAPDPVSARTALMARDWPAADVGPLVALIDDPRHRVSEAGTCRMSEEQARGILELRLQRLTGLGREEIGDELRALGEKIREFLEILGSRDNVMRIIREELSTIREAIGSPRRTEILEAESNFNDEDLIQREDMVVTVSRAGYIKRVPLDTYRAQRRGGKGRTGMSTRKEDFVTRMFVANTHTPVIFFSSRGIAYRLKVWRLPAAGPNARGNALVNLLPMRPGEKITSIMPLPEDESRWQKLNIMFATRSGSVRRNNLADFVNINRAGKIAMKLDDDDEIINVVTCGEDQDVLLTTLYGQSIRFPVHAVRVFAGRQSTGVRGIQLQSGDRVIAMALLRHFAASHEERVQYLRLRRLASGESAADDTAPDREKPGGEEADDAAMMTGEGLSTERHTEMGAAEQTILTLSRNGFGKRTSSFEYRTSRRGGKGITAMTVNKRNGHIVASLAVEDKDQIVLVTRGGQLIRCPVEGIRRSARSTQGVTVFNTAPGEDVVAVERISDPDLEPDQVTG